LEKMITVIFILFKALDRKTAGYRNMSPGFRKVNEKCEEEKQ
jgi:hypothetical protein